MEQDDLDSPKQPLPLRLLGLAWMAVALITLLTFWQGPYLLNLASSFRAHCLIALFTLGLPLAVVYPHRRRWAFISLPIVFGITFLSYVVPRASVLDPARSAGLRIALSNVHSSNLDLARLGLWLTDQKPDIAVLLEITEAHRAQIESLPFPYKSLHPRQSNFGLTLLSKTAPTRVQMLEEGTPFPSLLATWPEYRVLITHPIPPISREARDVGDEQVERLLKLLDTPNAPPLLVVGDLNATGWDRRLEPLKLAGLKEARLGHGLVPTWPADRPILGIPIDHIYLPNAWECPSLLRGPDIGSDHYPLLADIFRPRE